MRNPSGRWILVRPPRTPHVTLSWCDGGDVLFPNRARKPQCSIFVRPLSSPCEDFSDCPSSRLLPTMSAGTVNSSTPNFCHSKLSNGSFSSGCIFSYSLNEIFPTGTCPTMADRSIRVPTSEEWQTRQISRSCEVP